MENVFNTIGETPIWVWGTLGALAFGYRAMRKSDQPHDLDLTHISLSSCIGYAVCASVPVVTPIVLGGVGYEDYYRRRKAD